MQMDFSHWMALESAMQGEQPRRTFSASTLRRIAAFARPHRRALVAFLALSVVGAVLTVATPVLAGQVVDEITVGESEARVIQLAILIALVALLDAAVGVAERWQSSKIGEGLILDLRRAVFGHVQRMPVAFFTRTRTGALVSRLNNDVIGAQRAFTWTLSGVVSNLIALVLTLAVMLGLSWQITLLSLALLPVFVVPARRMGVPAGPPRARGRRPQLGHDHADDRALLGAGRDPGEAVRPSGPRGGRVHRPSRAGGRDRRAHRDGSVRVPHRPGAWCRPSPWRWCTASAARSPCRARWKQGPSSPSRSCSPASTRRSPPWPRLGSTPCRPSSASSVCSRCSTWRP